MLLGFADARIYSCEGSGVFFSCSVRFLVATRYRVGFRYTTVLKWCGEGTTYIRRRSGSALVANSFPTSEWNGGRVRISVHDFVSFSHILIEYIIMSQCCERSSH